jgi:hypothetical protein
VNSNAVISSINAASSIITQELTFSSIFSATALGGAVAGANVGSVLIDIGGIKYKIPLYNNP